MASRTPYNSLQDRNLRRYFSNERIKNHLKKTGLINGNGEIVSEKSYKTMIARKEHQKYVHDIMRKSIEDKANEKERQRRAEIKQLLEDIAKIEHVKRVRMERAGRTDEDIIPVLSGRDSTKQHQSANGKKGPSHRRPITSSKKHSLDKQLDHRAMTRTLMKKSCNTTGCPENFETVSIMLPRPPSSSSSTKEKAPYTPKSQKFQTKVRPKFCFTKSSMKISSNQHQSTCEVTLRYRRTSLRLQADREGRWDEIRVHQQYQGGRNQVIYKDLVEPGTNLVLTSRRNQGHPFSLTFFINGMQVQRLNACCEYKYAPNSLLGGSKGRFRLVKVAGDSACYRCMLGTEITRTKTQRHQGTQTDNVDPPPEERNQGTFTTKQMEKGENEIHEQVDGEKAETDREFGLRCPARGKFVLTPKTLISKFGRKELYFKTGGQHSELVDFKTGLQEWLRMRKNYSIEKSHEIESSNSKFLRYNIFKGQTPKGKTPGNIITASKETQTGNRDSAV